MTNHRINLEHIGKRMPYKVPDNFFQELEQNVRHELGGVLDNPPSHQHRNRNKSLFRFRYGIAIRALTTAAAVVALVIGGVLYLQHRNQEYAAIDRAFEQLDQNDQTVILESFYDDIFINEF